MKMSKRNCLFFHHGSAQVMTISWKFNLFCLSWKWENHHNNENEGTPRCQQQFNL